MNRMPVYFAGPYIFQEKAAAICDTIRHTAMQHGLEPLIPTDNSIPPGEPHQMAATIRAANYDMIRKSALIIAQISPFRGPNMDPGTAAEIGFATALEKPIILWDVPPTTLADRTRTCIPGCINDKAPDGSTIENFGLPENLMIAAPGGAIAQCRTLLDAMTVAQTFTARGRFKRT